MAIDDLLRHLASVSAPGAGALIAAWLAWRLWKRLLRAAIACVVVGLIVYLAFPDVAHQLVRHLQVPIATNTGNP